MLVNYRHDFIPVIGLDGMIAPNCSIESGDWSAVAPPFPIPNREVKRCSADDTNLATGGENRSLPELCKSLLNRRLFLYTEHPLGCFFC